MMYKTNKMRLQLYKTDNASEDSFASRRARTAKLRNIIRACFYLHCIAALICIALSIILSAGFDIVKVCVCTITSVVFAFFAVGDLEHVKAISCVIDFTFAAGAFITAALGKNKPLFIVCGIFMAILGISMIVSSIAASRKRALDNNPPFMLHRDKQQQNNYSAYPDYDDIPDMPEDYIIESPLVSVPQTPSVPSQPPAPQPYENMHRLADQVREILTGEADKTDT